MLICLLTNFPNTCSGGPTSLVIGLIGLNSFPLALIVPPTTWEVAPTTKLVAQIPFRSAFFFSNFDNRIVLEMGSIASTVDRTEMIKTVVKTFVTRILASSEYYQCWYFRGTPKTDCIWVHWHYLSRNLTLNHHVEVMIFTALFLLLRNHKKLVSDAEVMSESSEDYKNC